MSIKSDILNSLETRAEYDPLTEVYNRNAADAHIRKGLRLDPEERAAIVLIEVTDIRQINEKYGHHVGDLILKAAAKLIERQIGIDSVLGRNSGAQFIVLLKEKEGTKVEDIIEKIASAKRVVEYEGKAYEYSFSIGYCLSPSQGILLHDLAAKASLAMEKSREAGGRETGAEGELGADDKLIPKGLPGGFFIYDAKGDEEIYYADDNVIRLFGCTSMEEFREYTNNSFLGMVYPEDLEKVEGDIQKQTMFGEKRHDYVRYRIQAKTGEIRYIEDFGHLLHGDNGRSYFYVYIVDVDKDEYYNRNKNSFAEAQILSLNSEMDILTGLFNMPRFYECVQEELGKEDTRKLKNTIVYMDISDFKLFNERFGFQKGDELLYKVARKLWQSFDEHIIARFSDDHFVVYTHDEDVIGKIEDIQNDLSGMVEGTRVTLKAGIYNMKEEHCDVGIACDHARLACNDSKQRYDINYSLYNDELTERLKRRQYIVHHIDEAVEKEYIKVFYQPVIRVRTGELCGYEALARWKDPDVGMLSPADFIETLEQSHLIHKLDCFIIKKVCEDYKKLKEAGEPLVPVSINLSRLDFDLCDIGRVIDGYREQYGVPMNMLDIEITESALNDDSEGMKKEIKRLNDSGHQIWIDDFGSGYSSLNVLVEYVFDVLKLDMQFLRTYDHNENMGKLLAQIVAVTNKLGKLALQEGVETKEHYEFLKAIGCEKCQGYYFGKPQPMEETRETTRSKGIVWEKVG